MGCAQSRVNDDEAVTRCKERRQWMKAAVAARNAFAAAHSAYAASLKDTGAALSEFGQVAAHESVHSSSSSSTGGGTFASGAPVIDAAVQPPTETLLPPPPPLPEFSPSPLHRSISMPDLPKKFPSKIHQAAPILEEDNEGDDEAEEENDGGLNRRRRRPSEAAGGSPSLSPSPAPPPPPPSLQPTSQSLAWGLTDENMPVPSLTQAGGIRPEREEAPEEKIETSAPPPPVAKHDDLAGGDDEPVTPKKVVVETPLAPKVPRNQKQGGTAHHHHTASAPTLDAQRGKTVPAAPPSIELMKVLTDLDDLFLRASESTHEVSKVLEATRMHYHSNFVDSRGHVDHSARVMRVITWHRSFEVTPGADISKGDFIDDEWETHATVLDKILAWEKRLYDEVKAGKLVKIEYHRKVALLNRQKKGGASGESLQRTKAAVSHLHTKYVVDMQSMDSTVSEIHRLRDKRLYPILVQLVEGMARMWQAMHSHHHSQLRLMEDIKALDIANASKETSEHHHNRTLQLLDVVKEWQSQLHKLVTHQKQYAGALDSWLKLNLVPIDSSLKAKVSSPPRPAHAPIRTLVQAWHEYLEKQHPEELANTALLGFSAVLNTIEAVQQEELKRKERCGQIHKAYLRKKRAFEDWYQKQPQKRMGEPANGGEAASQNDPAGERRRVVESLKSQLDEEVEALGGVCKQVREKSLVALKTHLPELFRAVSDFAELCSKMYTSLKLVTDQNPPTK